MEKLIEYPDNQPIVCGFCHKRGIIVSLQMVWEADHMTEISFQDQSDLFGLS